MAPNSRTLAGAVKAANAAPTIRAYHGSPHDFDRFDASKIGTGEGAQTYGHGLYFAENPKVAAEYRARLAGVEPMEELVVAGRRLSPGNRWNYSPRNDSIEENVLSTLLENLMLDEHGLRAAGPKANELAIETLRSRSKHYPEEWPEAVDAAASLEKKMMAPGGVRVSFGKQPGAMYEVDIAQPENRFLGWEVPLSQHPQQIRDSLRSVYEDAGHKDVDQFLNSSDHTGRDAYESIGKVLTGSGKTIAAPAAAQRLAASGIPGVRYFDQFSRDAQQGTQNFVMFPGTEDSITILRKYGLLPAVGAGAAAQGSQQNDRRVLGGLMDGDR
jgi:hypothetical protein